MKRPVIKTLLVIGLVLVIVFGVAVLPAWKKAMDRGGQEPAEPFHIAGNLYYVGASDATAFLLTGPEGHILIDGGYPGTPPLIIASIAKLGFDIRDVKIILSSEPHSDHAGGLAELQRVSGASLWVSREAAQIMEQGGKGDPSWGTPHIPRNFSAPEILPNLHGLTEAAGLDDYPVPRIDHEISDGDTIRLGPIAVVAHVTGGHVPGCTSWTFPVRDGDRTLQVVEACGLGLMAGMSFVEPESYPGIAADFERTFTVLRSLPVDIFLATHARDFGRYRKFTERGITADSVAPFIDPKGYHEYIDNAEKAFREQVAEQRARQKGAGTR